MERPWEYIKDENWSPARTQFLDWALTRNERRFTRRQAQVCCGVYVAWGHDRIALMLDIKSKTVESHARDVLRMTNECGVTAANMAELVQLDQAAWIVELTRRLSEDEVEGGGRGARELKPTYSTATTRRISGIAWVTALSTP